MWKKKQNKTNEKKKNSKLRDCAIIIRRGAVKLELSSKNLDTTPPPKKKENSSNPPLLC